MRMRMAAAIALLVLVTACSAGDEKRAQVQSTLRQALAAQKRPAYVTSDAEGRKLWKLTRQFYERRQYVPAWIDGTSPRPQMQELIRALNAAHSEGLDPQLYSVGLVEQRRQEATKGFLTKQGFKAEDAGGFDAFLTYLYMKYASDLADGLSDLAHADSTWQIKPEKFDPAAHLDTALQNNSVEDSLIDLTPENPQYRALRRILADYRTQSGKGGWPAVPTTLRLKAGQRSPHVRALAQRLAASGDYSGGIPDTREAVYR